MTNITTPMTNYERIYDAVSRIPPGRVATYGQIAALAGLDGHARQIGYALHGLQSGSDVPWHRVINAKGAISARSTSDSHELQRILLESEGVVFDAHGRIPLADFRWEAAAAVTETTPLRSFARSGRRTRPTRARERR